MLGIVIAVLVGCIVGIIDRQNRIGRAFAWCLSLAALMCTSELLMGIGAAGVIALCLPSEQRGTSIRIIPLEWLGHVSYSLYLVHLPICVLVIRTVPHLPLLINIVITVVLSLFSADVIWRYIERPTATLCRRLTIPRPNLIIERRKNESYHHSLSYTT
jgi:peptidoglycan/LPS O-acetylase OafA/YrhL